MKVLITGGSGFLASSLIRLLISKRPNFSIDIMSQRKEKEAKKGSASQVFTYDQIEALPDIYDFVFHLAAKVPYGQMNSKDQELVIANIDLTSRLCRQFATARFIFTSSVSVYGSTQEKVITESTPINTASLANYAATKLAGELIVQQNKSYAIVRLSSLYGPGMAPKTFIPIIVNSAKTKNVITLFGDGKRHQNYLFVEDAARLLLNLAESEKNGLILGVSPETLSNKQVAEKIRSFIPSVLVEYKGEDKSFSRYYQQLDPSSLVPEFNFTSFSTGMKQIIISEID